MIDKGRKSKSNKDANRKKEIKEKRETEREKVRN